MKNKILKPKIRFKGFTDTWEQRKLDDLVDFYRGRGLSWNDITDDGKNECVLYGNLYTDYGMVISKIKYKTNVNKDSMFLSKFGDVLIPASDTTSTGLARATSIDKSDVILGGDINVLRPKKDNGDFISYSINVKRTELIKRIKGTTVRHLSNSDIEDLEIIIAPNIDEQIKISKILTKIDNLITLHQSKYDKLVNIKNALLEKMFPKDGKNVPEIRFKGFTDTWEQRKLKDIVTYRRGSFPQPYGKEEWYGGTKSMPFVQVADVSDELKLNSETKQTISIVAQPMSVFIPKESVIVTLQGTIGRVAITQYDAFLDRTILYFDTYLNHDIDKYFWAITIKNKFEEERKKAPGAVIKTITKEVLSEFDIQLTTKDEQMKIGQLFKQIDNLITLHQHKLEKLKNMKKSLLNKMFI